MPTGIVTSPIFQPATREVTGITQAFPAVVTTAQDHNYLDSDVIRITIPKGFGMQQINDLFGRVTVIDTTSFEIDIDAREFDAFSDPGDTVQYAQSVPIGSAGNNTLKGANKNTLPSRNR